MSDSQTTEAGQRVREIRARLLQLNRAIPNAERYLWKLRDEQITLMLEWKPADDEMRDTTSYPRSSPASTSR